MLVLIFGMTTHASRRQRSLLQHHAERGVALVQESSCRLTKDEEQLQFVMQIVAEHRKKIPNALKQNLTGPQ